MQSHCKLCYELKESNHIENKANLTDSTHASFFPDSFYKLKSILNKDYESYADNNAKLLKCPECYQYFLWEELTPGGSDDAMTTYIHESLRRINNEEAIFLMKKLLHTFEMQANKYESIFRENFNWASPILNLEINDAQKK